MGYRLGGTFDLGSKKERGIKKETSVEDLETRGSFGRSSDSIKSEFIKTDSVRTKKGDQVRKGEQVSSNDFSISIPSNLRTNSIHDL